MITGCGETPTSRTVLILPVQIDHVPWETMPATGIKKFIIMVNSAGENRLPRDFQHPLAVIIFHPRTNNVSTIPHFRLNLPAIDWKQSFSKQLSCSQWIDFHNQILTDWLRGALGVQLLWQICKPNMLCLIIASICCFSNSKIADYCFEFNWWVSNWTEHITATPSDNAISAFFCLPWETFQLKLWKISDLLSIGTV